ncbi:FAD-binding and (Fe-S)-binding domain-containing protein [Halomonas rhizosphaerae]|uniref:D-lactate dehydrogenase (cytochrome) n=1 Tax=Halomonas rhizosphaerae TaxID=3043296 RepID=A0ABT6UYG8_9GAMM|nr:FAD-binding and (Fe-S)-binding domain-containing protein [Halomonas rhizosphaerae]MDI5891027.1 FAD-binding and (Fe-S)-binding domain-containing protein [Halomonas rhizosphaerae]MDI5919564.1 FAD-binding and (Fe-S)-binding domain-containing protein [Halomonas rhizosphaerae]
MTSKTAWRELKAALAATIPAERLIDDPLRTLAYGTDASFYRLVPQLVVRPENEAELQRTLAECRERELPVTFRAAGTSLSGQAVTDSVLIQFGRGWRDHAVLDEGQAIRLQPGVIGARANQLLAPYGRKIGPDPASIASCMVGGIAANNASGMCCGTAQNSYRTVRDIRVILADGSLLDTADAASVAAFRASHGVLLAGLERLAAQTQGNDALAGKIRHKYRLKNTTGYALNSLVDFSDGIEILKHLMIGSEGTLGFISTITYDTVVDEPLKAAALAFFPDMGTTCRATIALKQAPVSAVELMDRAALRSVQDQPGMPAVLRTLPEGAAALLVDVRGNDEAELEARMQAVQATLEGIQTLEPVTFTRDAATYALYWKIRKGLFPAVGAVRETGTTVIIEDVAFPIERLDEGVLALTDIFHRHGYRDAILFGHALEGNLHFVFPQGFEKPGEVERYQALMDEVAQLVGVEYGGSLKAEHGTGRNMAPYVELEWGPEAYALMWEIKALFDPGNLLNPEVILSRNPTLHLENLKPLPAADAIVDKCIECGFCEAVCPSTDLTLTPRQRIVIRRELARLEALGNQVTDADKDRMKQLEEAYVYQGIDTCAATGLCATQCPVGIDTGEMVRQLRRDRSLDKAALARRIGRHFSGATRAARGGLTAAGAARAVLGVNLMEKMSTGARRLSGDRLPQWSPALPRSAPVRVLEHAPSGDVSRDKVVYLPSCATRIFGTAHDDEAESRSVMEITLALLDKAGFEVILPEMIGHLCCGMAFKSKGQYEEANHKARELNRELLVASQNGRYPVLCDTSPCTLQMREHLDERLEMLEPVAFAHDHLLPRLAVTPLDERVAVHVTCSSTRMGLADKFVGLVRACAREVVVPAEITCCGFAGDKGFTTPELNASALEGLAEQVKGCSAGYSNSRTCEIGLSQHGNIPYRSILSLLDRASRSASG